MRDLQPFPLDLIEVGAAVPMLGSSGCGKSTMLQYLFYAHVGKTHRKGTLMVKSHTGYDWHPKVARHEEFAEELLYRAYEKQQKRTQMKLMADPDMDNSYWVIIDDVMDKKKVQNAEILGILFLKGRHCDMTTFALAQRYTHFITELRDNFNIFIMFKEKHEENRRKLWKMIPGFKDFKEFDRTFQEYTKDGQALVYVDLPGRNMNKLEDNLFYLRIPDHLMSTGADGKKYFNKKFGVGCQKFQDMEKKNYYDAKLEAAIEKNQANRKKMMKKKAKKEKERRILEGKMNTIDENASTICSNDNSSILTTHTQHQKSLLKVKEQVIGSMNRNSSNNSNANSSTTRDHRNNYRGEESSERNLDMGYDEKYDEEEDSNSNDEDDDLYNE